MSISSHAPSIAAAKSDAVERAILFADLAGYSAMMGKDELGTLEFMVECSHLIDETAKSSGGELVQTAGDGYFILFPDVDAAIEFGMELHRLVARRQMGQKNPACFRIGIHHGPVHQVEGQVLSHAVNVTARIQTQARPGTCAISECARDMARTQSHHAFEPIGSPSLKNISQRIALFQISPESEAEKPVGETMVVSLIGPLSVTAVTVARKYEPNRESAALLGYLVLAPGMREREAKIENLLWPEQDDRSAQLSLAKSWRGLKETLPTGPDEVVISANGYSGLNEMRFETDLSRIISTLRRGQVPSVLIENTDWPEQILSGFADVSPVFSAWCSVSREHWRNRILTALSDNLQDGQPLDDNCRDAAVAILAVEPGNERASSTLIRYHAEKGDRQKSVQEYDRLRRYLKSEYGLVPSDTVSKALSDIQNPPDEPKSTLASAQPEKMPANRVIRISVDPFEGQDDESRYLISGFRSELIANLARFREWSVVEQTGNSGDSATDATGRYRISGVASGQGLDGLDLCLSKASTGRVVWREHVVLDPHTWSNLQRGVVGRIAAHLETYISADRLAKVIGKAGDDATSYDKWLQAEKVFARWLPEAADEAESILNQVIERDPDFAPAFSSLAGFRNVAHFVRPGSPRDTDSDQTAYALAQHAVALDPLDARNQLAVAWTAALAEDFDRAAIYLDLAASLNPNCPATLISCAMGHAFNGNPGRGEALVDHALRISPMLNEYQWCYIASVYFLSRRYEDALAAAQKSGDRIVDNQGWNAAALIKLDRKAEAKTAFENLIDAVRPVWSGTESPTAETVFDWFVGSYPLREAHDRELLSESLAEALRGQ